MKILILLAMISIPNSLSPEENGQLSLVHQKRSSHYASDGHLRTKQDRWIIRINEVVYVMKSNPLIH